MMKSIPLGSISFQSPKGGAKIKKGREVRLFLSKGPQPKLLQNVVGLSVEQAKRVLSGQGLIGDRVRVNRIPYEEGESGHVVAQQPSNDTPLEAVGRVALLVKEVSKTTYWLMPDIVGKSRIRVMKDFKKKGITVRYSGKGYRIREQFPQPGVKISIATQVELVCMGG